MKKSSCNVFGKRLSELREEKRLTQTELSQLLDIQRVTIAKYETGERAPSIDNLISFAEFFDVSADYLLNLSPAKSNDKADLKAVCDYIGFSEETVETLKCASNYRTRYAENKLLFSSKEFKKLFYAPEVTESFYIYFLEEFLCVSSEIVGKLIGLYLAEFEMQKISAEFEKLFGTDKVSSILQKRHNDFEKGVISENEVNVQAELLKELITKREDCHMEKYSCKEALKELFENLRENTKDECIKSHNEYLKRKKKGENIGKHNPPKE